MFVSSDLCFYLNSFQCICKAKLLYCYGYTKLTNLTVVVLFLYFISAYEVIGQNSNTGFPGRVPGRCDVTNGSLLFDCGEKCIAFNQVRDCARDCQDGGDEECPATTILCDTFGGRCGKCVSPNLSLSDCQDRQCYQRLCNESNIFKCASTANCVPVIWTMDGKNDCFDSSDEDPCLTQKSNCSRNASCQFDSARKFVNCTCLSGLVGDGYSCQPLNPCRSGNVSVCSVNASCNFDSITNIVNCTCNEGFTGNGAVCTEIPTDCSALIASTCHPNATCVFNQTTMVATCICDRYFIGDGIRCEHDLPRRIPGSCSSKPLEFDCGDGICLPIRYFRDCSTDCPNGVDEVCWPGQVKCGSCACVLPSQLNSTVCSNNTGFEVCAHMGMFACASGNQCTADSSVLDRVSDCADDSDERVCFGGQPLCPISHPCVYAPLSHSYICGCPVGMAIDMRGFCVLLSMINRN